ncbi:MAG: helix-turn-helix transcriptional regulator [Sedimentibacter sp.]|uniref:helix-turn-helix domain-containing protein n=1 Tax=Sedimentibacter sp. TaxID=1960295 RepID=UPI00315855BD
MTLGEKMRKIRKENDMTKQELGIVLNVPKERIKLYESNEEKPSDFYLSSFAQHFSISVDELLADEQNN